MNVIREPAREIPVCSKADICVIGGSCTGVFAAVRAARLGAKVVLIEKDNCLGGVATSGLVNVWHKLTDVDNRQQIIAGLTQEVLERLSRIGAVNANPREDVLAAYSLNTEELKIELDHLVTEEKIEVLFHSMYCSAYWEDDIVKAIIVENKNGRQAVSASFFIDASGDGDLARDLGLKSYSYSHTQPPSPCYKLYGALEGVPLSQLIQQHGAEYGLAEDWGWSGDIPGAPQVSFRADTHVFGCDCADAKALSNAEIEGRRQVRAIMDILRKYVDKDRFSLLALCSHLGIRETRHFESEFQIKGEELLYGHTYDDAVAYGTYPVDVHHSDSAGITFRHLDGFELIHSDRTSAPLRRNWRIDGKHAPYYQIPFRTLIQRKYLNFLPVGRMINADESAYGAVRVMVNLNQLGEAAGTAAYLSIQKNQPIFDLDTIPLRQALKNGGSIIL